MHPTSSMVGLSSPPHQKRRPLRLILNNFGNNKAQCLGKRDKSSAGRIDPRAVEICALLNTHEAYFTTSSCAGRCFLYRGAGIKATQQFSRFRVSHDCIQDPARYFDLTDTALKEDPTGGGDPIRSIGQFEHAVRLREYQTETSATQEGQPMELEKADATASAPEHLDTAATDKTIWLRFEPFILHVACRSLEAAAALMTAARPAFKNVGLTTWKEDTKFLVAVWGDEGLEMPLTTPVGTPLMAPELSSWLATLVNERHERNWGKIDRFVQAVREMPTVVDDLEQEEGDAYLVTGDTEDPSQTQDPSIMPRSFDVVGDIAVLHSLATTDAEERRRVGEAILQKNKGIKVVALRESALNGFERAPGQEGFVILAGAARSPLITTHNEYGIKCVVDLQATFFSPRMGPERLRICQQVARGEHVLVLFCGVGMDAMQIAGRTEASSVVAIELNEVAIECARRAHRMLERNKGVKCVGAAERLQIIQADVLEVVPTLPKDHFDRIVAPRPKEGALDGDLGDGDGGLDFLDTLLPVLKQDGGECHWYEFVADHEFPTCERSRRLLTQSCEKHELTMEVIHVAKVGSVAKRQFRCCIDFRVFRKR